MRQNPSSTSSFDISLPLNQSLSDAREARRFAVLLAKLVVLPTVIAVFFVEIVGWRMGITMPVAEIARLQHENPRLIWAGDGQLYTPLKLARIAAEKPDVVFI